MELVIDFKSMNQKGFKKITLLVILIIVLMSVSVYFVFFKKSGKVIIDPTLITNQIANWKIYTNSAVGFSFKYPTDWNVEESIEKGTTWGNLPIVSVYSNKITSNIEGAEIKATWRVSYIKDIYGGLIDSYMATLHPAIVSIPRKITNEIDNHKTYVVYGKSFGTLQDFRVVFHNGYVFNLDGPSASFFSKEQMVENIFSQIISTFTFTK